MIQIARLTGFSVAVIASVLTLLLLGPAEPERFQPIQVEGNQELISQALEDYEANSTAAGEDLALQTVVNGWVARDFLYVVANELDAVSDQLTILSAQTDALANATEPDERLPVLLLIGVVTFAFHAATLPFAAPPVPRPRQRAARQYEARDDDWGDDWDDDRDVDDDERDDR